MRFILQEDVYEDLPPDWDNVVARAEAYVERKVAKAKSVAEAAGRSPDEVEEICLKTRHRAINAKAHVWRYAEKALRKASHEKCWYCESRQDRSDKPVDHFRPKNAVVEAPGHPGYWWLAFNWRNYRYSCTFCNSRRCDIEGGTEGGKHDHFPIIEPPPHARCASDPIERPKLLDPIDDADTKLLTFLPNGFSHPANDAPETVDRVKESISLYHLDHSALVRRRKMLAAEIDEHIFNAEEAQEKGDVANYRYQRKEIIKRVRAQAEFSSAARVFLCAHRHRPWVEAILNRDL